MGGCVVEGRKAGGALVVALLKVSGLFSTASMLISIITGLIFLLDLCLWWTLVVCYFTVVVRHAKKIIDSRF